VEKFFESVDQGINLVPMVIECLLLSTNIANKKILDSPLDCYNRLKDDSATLGVMMFFDSKE
jgi:hypothetical protein